MPDRAVKAQDRRLSPTRETATDNDERESPLRSILRSKARKLLNHSPRRRS
jgi:hypothetical protein